MPKEETFVVNITGTDMYLTGYNYGNPPASTFGMLENAIEYSTLEEAENIAAAIGPGLGGVPRPK